MTSLKPNICIQESSAVLPIGKLNDKLDVVYRRQLKEQVFKQRSAETAAATLTFGNHMASKRHPKSIFVYTCPVSRVY